MSRKVELVGTEALTIDQTRAVLIALQSVLMRDQNRRGEIGYEPTLTPTQWRRANEAYAKIKFAVT